MAKYKQPKTRIKVVEDGWGTRYYPQYHIVLVPFLLQGWECILGELDNPDFVGSLEEAKGRIDRFLLRNKQMWTSNLEEKSKKRVKKKVQYIDYP